MRPPQLENSKEWIKRGFQGLGELPRASAPLAMRAETIAEDAERFGREFNGSLVGKDGREVLVFSGSAPNLPELFLIEFIDPEKKLCCGACHFLFYPSDREVNVGNLNLSEIRSHGFGQRAAERFRSYLPSGIKLTFAIDEIHTKGFLLYLTDQLMEHGEITDWRIHSPDRPIPEKGEPCYLPEADQRVIQEQFFAALHSHKSPLLRVLKNLGVTPYALRTRLNDDGRWTYTLITVCE
jgi:hypothetical protein